MRTKKERGLTGLQRRALECVRGAQAKAVTLSAYCRSRGVNLRQVYDALIPLRRRGLLPTRLSRAAVRQARQPRAGQISCERFVALKVSPPPTHPACRVVLPGGIWIECAQWPPRAWLSSLSAADGTDAAT